MNLAARFWKYVDTAGAGGCWLWRGAPTKAGYGRMSVGGRDGRETGAHRVAYELLRGPIPTGLVLDHLCRTQLCVNPDHLEPVSQGENIRRGSSPESTYARRTACPKGHPFATWYDGRRRCLTCWTARRRERAAIRRASRTGLAS